MLLDQRRSQANRCEPALPDAVRRQGLFIPHLELTTEAEGMSVRITSLEARRHRARSMIVMSRASCDLGTASW
ncbi:type I-U CRISPR-associated protein Cas7 [Streptomyces sp. NPDC007164]|uniref:type I-G CRISPR-associated protein Cas7 n=1 Tax=Streptomyces sp. NPDC007164 TaxID=3156918 RepID=UPI00340BEBB0